MMTDPLLDQNATAPTEPPRSLWRNRDYMLLWSGQLVSTLGSGVSMLAYPLLLLALTHSPAQAGLAGALGSLPYLIISLPAGALVDRWDRKRVMMICDAGRGLNMASIPIAALLGHLTVAQLYVTSLVEGTFYVFFNLAEAACLPRVVPKAQLPTASAQSEGGSIAASLVSPTLSGFLFKSVGQAVPFLGDAISYAASVASLSLITTEFQERRTGVDGPLRLPALRAEIAEGLRWLWHQPLIRYMAVLTGGLNFANAAMDLILIVIAQHLGATPTAIGLMFSIGSAGGLLGATVAPRIQRRFGFGRVIVTMVWIDAVLWPLFVVAPSPLLLGVILFGLFATSPIYNAVQFGYRISIIPDELQGRVNGAFRMSSFGFQPLGAALSGVLIQGIGARPAALAFAAVVVALALLTTLNAGVRTARPIGA